MEVVPLFILLVFLTNPSDAGRYHDCPEDWTQVNTKCYIFVEEKAKREIASGRCRDRYAASLAMIENKEENEAVQDLIHGSAWIGLRRSYGHYNWDDRYTFTYANWRYSPDRSSQPCTIMLETGDWKANFCFLRYSYVCWKEADCEPGWTGDKCDRKCHCYLGYVCNVTHTCPYGCDPGWDGDRCDTRLAKPTASFYCTKVRGGYSLMASFDRKGVDFWNMGAVNAEGEISPKCGKDKFRWDKEMRLNVQIRNVSGVWESDCPAEIVEKRILKWTFRLQKKKDVVSFEDEEIQVQCDLSEADAVYELTERVEIEGIRERSSTAATQTRVSVRTYLANPDSLEPVTNLSLGVPVRLVATLQEGDDVDNPYFHFWSCQAASPDGNVTVQLTDDSGCSLRRDLRFGIMHTASGVIQSYTFPMFYLPGYTEVVFSCALGPSHMLRHETRKCPRRG
ncbi:uncharacterized protein LOC124134615 [Haliotis rufescens]|uniref:uncharacterized protein LOC124134615 n=1 Tax=Haliotis rufescens TaxID=6454 RepID=UPI00201ECC3F|nr:uncharacterized protein LOC124134615 [Haliotis rufescens]XP_048256407.1 uncharacterized protein LOC124134615 [Haliotis rufescens]